MMTQTKHSGKIGLVRHGETYANIDKVWHGHTDTELTDTGKKQAQRLGEHFHHYMQPDVIYTSPLQRAKITAQAIGNAFDLEVNHDPRLMEFHLGDWEGKNFSELMEENGVVDQLVNNPDFTAPNGESQAMVRARVVEAIDEIVQNHPNENIVIVAHGVALGIAIAHYVNADTTAWPEYTKNNTAFSEICLNTNSLIRFNQTHHLSD